MKNLCRTPLKAHGRSKGVILKTALEWIISNVIHYSKQVAVHHPGWQTFFAAVPLRGYSLTAPIGRNCVRQ